MTDERKATNRIITRLLASYQSNLIDRNIKWLVDAPITKILDWIGNEMMKNE